MTTFSCTHRVRAVLLAFALLFSAKIFAQWQPLPGPNGGKVTCWAEAANGDLYAGGTAGIFKSTDGGKNWRYLPGNAQIAQSPTELEWDKGNLYMATQAYNSSERGLWKSTDDGTTWVRLRNDIFDQIEYMGVFDARNDTIVVNASPTGFLSKDGGQTWEPSVTYGVWNILGTAKGWFSSFYSTVYRWATDVAWLVAYQSSDSNFHPGRLLEAGDRTFLFFVNGTTFKTTKDNGLSWQDGTLPVSYDSRAVSVAARNDTFFVQADNLVVFSTDDAQTWDTMPTSGLPGAVRACFFHPSGSVVALTDSGIFRAEKPGAAFGPAAGYTSLDIRTALPEGNGKWWLGTGRGLFFSPDNGQTWESKLDDFGNPFINWVRRVGPNVLAGSNTVFFHSPDGGLNWQKRTPPIATMADVEVIGNEVFTAGCDGYWRSGDWGATWQKFDPTGTGSTYCARVWERRDSLLAVAAQWSDVYLSRDTGATWQNFSAGLGGIPYIAFEVGISPEHLFVVSGFRLMRSPLAGPQWSELTLPVPVTAADGPLPRYFDFADDTIRAGIPAAGIFRSTDGGQTWSAWSATDLYRRANSFQFLDSLTVMCINGGVWYVGSLPGASTVGGRVFVDANQNQTFDTGDTPLPGHLVQLKNQQLFTATAADGRYSFDWRGQADSLQLTFFTAGATATPAVHFASGPTDTLDFAVAPLTLGTDLALDLSAASVPRPGFQFIMHLTCRNDGYLPAAGRVSMVKDARLAWLSFSETPDQIVGDTVFWRLPDVAPGGFANFHARLQVDANTPLGAWLYFSGKATSDGVLDLDGSNNIALTVIQVVGSFDPNDKSVAPVGPISPAMVADSQQLAYTVRFQNTGTFPAEFVRITDTLSPNLDLASLRVLAASHTFEWSLRGRVVEFYFPNIQLPDSTSDEPGSHGFVKFSLRVRPDLQKGDAVENFADIFFDFNTPVRTNTVRTLVDEISGTAAPAALQPLVCRVAPNPVRDVLTISWKNPLAAPGTADVEIFDQHGRSLRAFGAANSPAQISVRDLPPGNYWLKIRASGREGAAQWVKM